MPEEMTIQVGLEVGYLALNSLADQVGHVPMAGAAMAAALLVAEIIDALNDTIDAESVEKEDN